MAHAQASAVVDDEDVVRGGDEEEAADVAAASYAALSASLAQSRADAERAAAKAAKKKKTKTKTKGARGGANDGDDDDGDDGDAASARATHTAIEEEDVDFTVGVVVDHTHVVHVDSLSTLLASLLAAATRARVLVAVTDDVLADALATSMPLFARAHSLFVYDDTAVDDDAAAAAATSAASVAVEDDGHAPRRRLSAEEAKALRRRAALLRATPASTSASSLRTASTPTTAASPAEALLGVRASRVAAERALLDACATGVLVRAPASIVGHRSLLAIRLLARVQAAAIEARPPLALHTSRDELSRLLVEAAADTRRVGASKSHAASSSSSSSSSSAEGFGPLALDEEEVRAAKDEANLWSLATAAADATQPTSSTLTALDTVSLSLLANVGVLTYGVHDATAADGRLFTRVDATTQTVAVSLPTQPLVASSPAAALRAALELAAASSPTHIERSASRARLIAAVLKDAATSPARLREAAGCARIDSSSSSHAPLVAADVEALRLLPPAADVEHARSWLALALRLRTLGAASYACTRARYSLERSPLARTPPLALDAARARLGTLSLCALVSHSRYLRLDRTLVDCDAEFVCRLSDEEHASFLAAVGSSAQATTTINDDGDGDADARAPPCPPVVLAGASRSSPFVDTAARRAADDVTAVDHERRFTQLPLGCDVVELIAAAVDPAAWHKGRARVDALGLGLEVELYGSLANRAAEEEDDYEQQRAAGERAIIVADVSDDGGLNAEEGLDDYEEVARVPSRKRALDDDVDEDDVDDDGDAHDAIRRRRRLLKRSRKDTSVNKKNNKRKNKKNKNKDVNDGDNDDDDDAAAATAAAAAADAARAKDARKAAHSREQLDGRVRAHARGMLDTRAHTRVLLMRPERSFPVRPLLGWCEAEDVSLVVTERRGLALGRVDALENLPFGARASLVSRALKLLRSLDAAGIVPCDGELASALEVDASLRLRLVDADSPTLVQTTALGGGGGGGGGSGGSPFGGGFGASSSSLSSTTNAKVSSKGRCSNNRDCTRVDVRSRAKLDADCVRRVLADAEAVGFIEHAALARCDAGGDDERVSIRCMGGYDDRALPLCSASSRCHALSPTMTWRTLVRGVLEPLLGHAELRRAAPHSLLADVDYVLGRSLTAEGHWTLNEAIDFVDATLARANMSDVSAAVATTLADAIDYVDREWL